MQAITKLLNYCVTNPNAVVRYQASDMVLHVESDAFYLSVSKARSQTAGFFYMSDRPTDPKKASAPNSPPPIYNGPISISCHIMKEVLSSAAEAGLAGLFHNKKMPG
mmetsp:Transcript_26328/g.37397  ORF Transcript_26328/g.37397 Transcript_26328/m.37397 type:complete len:107 (-) Transcript_26328:27-347(-)